MAVIRRPDGRLRRNPSLTFSLKNAPFGRASKLPAERCRARSKPEKRRLGNGVHPVLRGAIEEAKARLLAGARVAFAMLRMFAFEVRATMTRLCVYGAALGAM